MYWSIITLHSVSKQMFCCKTFKTDWEYSIGESRASITDCPFKMLEQIGRSKNFLVKFVGQYLETLLEASTWAKRNLVIKTQKAKIVVPHRPNWSNPNEGTAKPCRMVSWPHYVRAILYEWKWRLITTLS